VSQSSDGTMQSKLNAGLVALGILALSAAGFLSITTPGEQSCRDELSVTQLECARELGDSRADAVMEISALRAQVDVLAYKNQALLDAAGACQKALDATPRRSRRAPEVEMAYEALGEAEDAMSVPDVSPPEELWSAGSDGT